MSNVHTDFLHGRVAANLASRLPQAIARLPIDHWRGELPLANAIMIGGAAALGALCLGAKALGALGTGHDLGSGGVVLAAGVAGALLWWTVGVWRSATREIMACKWRHTSTIALHVIRLLCGLWSIGMLGALLVGGTGLPI